MFDCSNCVVYNFEQFQEFERAIRQRDNLIEDLTASLQQALSARDALLTKVSVVSSAKLPDKPDDQVRLFFHAKKISKKKNFQN